ncbi:MAG: GNAT family N-acetyltransferase [Desulfovibrionaceae bacterium]|nr:GNAT family N-acetyltransferase [Desulfovibrionaceae bacterium]
MLSIRDLREDEYGLLEDYLYMALYVPEGCRPHPRDILRIPELRLYYENFGSSESDLALACDDDGRVIGICWARIMNDFSHIDDSTPSLVVSLADGCRGMGLGTKLVLAMLERLRERGYRSVSLSVQVSHPAQHLYRRLGFTEVRRVMGETEEEIVMVHAL